MGTWAFLLAKPCSADAKHCLAVLSRAIDAEGDPRETFENWLQGDRDLMSATQRAIRFSNWWKRAMESSSE